MMDLNNFPISRKALEMLGDAGRDLDGNGPYFIRLALWALQSGIIKSEDDVLETITAMMSWRTERIANFLMLRHEEDAYEPSGWEEAANAVELASSIIDDIERKIVIHFPWYRSFES
jgi:hypothetical protein